MIFFSERNNHFFALLLTPLTPVNVGSRSKTRTLTTFNIVGSLRDREVVYSASDGQGSNFESCVWRAVSSHSPHHPQEVLLAQFILCAQWWPKPHSFLLRQHHVTGVVVLVQYNKLITGVTAFCSSQKTQNICITLVQRRHNVFDVGPTLYKCFVFTGLLSPRTSRTARHSPLISANKKN